MVVLNNRAVLAAIEGMLINQGFKKSKNGIFVKPRAEGVTSWLGLNKAVHSGSLEVNLVIGLRFNNIEKIVYGLLNEKDDGLTPPTIAGNVGYVGDFGKYFGVTFASGGDIEHGVKELESALIKWGFAFFERINSLGDLYDVLSTAKYLMPEQASYRLPVVLRLLGRETEAIAFIQLKIEAESNRRDFAAERYRDFAKAFCSGSSLI